METIGTYLQAKRKAKGLSLETINQKTKISLSSLEAMEADQFESIGAQTYVKGFIRSYARALELDPAEVLGRYQASKDSQVEDAEVRQALREIGETTAQTKRRWDPRWKDLARWTVLGATGLLAAYLTVSVIAPRLSRDPVALAVNFADAKRSIGIKDDHIYLLAGAVKDVWVSVRRDEEAAKILSLKKGDTAVWKARKRFVLKIGNAGGLELQLNDRPLGVLGRMDEVIPAVTIEANGHISYGAPESLTQTAK